MSLAAALTPLRRGRALALRSAPEQASPIAGQIAEVERALASLATERPDLALDAINGFAGAEVRLAELDSKAAALSARLGVLADAFAAAEAVDRRAADQRRATARATAIAKVHTHLRARDTAATKLSKAIAEAIEAFRELLDQSRQAQAACPAGEAWPEGGLTDSEALARMVSTEISRLDRPAAMPIFPRGAIALTPDLTPLPERIMTSSRFVFDQLTRRRL